MINNFSYDYPLPSGTHPLAVVTEVSGCPWEVSHRLLRIGIKGRRLPPEGPPPSNFVFLVDVSGSMGVSGKLPLFKQGLRQFVSNLHNQDRISIITYAGEAGLHLASTPGDKTILIKDAIDRLKAGGSTAGCEGIQLAYRLANSNFISNGNNRIVLVTDGNFNIGESNENDLVKMIEKKRGNGIFLTIIGMNIENDEDEKTMERLANNGDGNFSTVFSKEDLNSVLFSMSETFFTVAKDVKIQVQFSPERVEAYRLLGYENRMLQNSDFADDTKDAGEIGAEQCVTALYEIAPIKHSNASQLFSTVNIRYKDGTNEISKLMTSDVYARNKPIEMSSTDFRFATAVAGLGLLLINSSYKGSCTYDAVIDLASSAANGPYSSQRYGFIELARKCKSLTQKELVSIPF
jgi:Ca-activated chloride channel family protein